MLRIKHAPPVPRPRHLVKTKLQEAVFKCLPMFMTNENLKTTTEKNMNHDSSAVCGSLDFRVSTLPLSSLPPLFVFEVHIQIHITPLFTAQGLNYMGFWFCKPEFIAASLFAQTTGAFWNMSFLKPQSFCSACHWRVCGPLLIGSIGSAQDCFGQGVATSEVGVTMGIVFSWCYILQVFNCIVALVAVHVVDVASALDLVAGPKRKLPPIDAHAHLDTGTANPI